MRKIVVDHDHAHCNKKTGCAICVRGFICQSCNSALGRWGDTIEGISRVIAYLTDTRERILRGEPIGMTAMTEENIGGS